jgi:hypothetical protein
MGVRTADLASPHPARGVEFYGVSMTTTRSIALDWWQSSAHTSPVDEALALGQHPITEVKLAGISILDRIFIPEWALDASHLPQMHLAMRGGAFDDWNTCDWFCVKVLHKVMTCAPSHAHKEMLSWSDDEVVWSK